MQFFRNPDGIRGDYGWLALPLAPLLIFWLNIITDMLLAMALALEPSAPNAMKDKPRNPEERLLNAPFAWLIIWQGFFWPR